MIKRGILFLVFVGFLFITLSFSVYAVLVPSTNYKCCELNEKACYVLKNNSCPLYWNGNSYVPWPGYNNYTAYRYTNNNDCRTSRMYKQNPMGKRMESD